MPEVTEKMGPSQQAVLDWINQQDHPVESVETGLALYDKISSCAKLKNTFWSKDQIRRAWAGKLLQLLARKGYIQRVGNGYYQRMVT